MAAKQRATHCIRGHEFNAVNTYTYKNRTKRKCRVCLRKPTTIRRDKPARRLSEDRLQFLADAFDAGLLKNSPRENLTLRPEDLEISTEALVRKYLMKKERISNG